MVKRSDMEKPRIDRKIKRVTQSGYTRAAESGA
jgi:hypothetical protein